MSPPTKRKADSALAAAWDDARPRILSAIAQALARRTGVQEEWVDVRKLLPIDRLALRSWGPLWKERKEIGCSGTHRFDVEGYHLLRHSFGNSFCLWCCSGNASDNLVEVEKAAMRKRPKDDLRNIPSIENTIKSDLEKLIAAKDNVSLVARKRPTMVSPELDCTTGARATRSDTATAQLKESATQLDAISHFGSLSTPEKQSTLWNLIESAKQADALQAALCKIQTEPTAQDMLLLFRNEFQNMTYAQRLLKSEEVAAKGSVAPRKSGFQDLSVRSKREVGSVMTAIALRVAQVLLPQDSAQGHGQLLSAIQTNPLFQRHVMPDVGEDDYKKWAKHPAVSRIKTKVDSLGMSDYDQKVRIVALLSDYPTEWIKRLMPTVGDKAVKDSKESVALVDAGLPVDTTVIKRNRRHVCEA